MKVVTSPVVAGPSPLARRALAAMVGAVALLAILAAPGCGARDATSTPGARVGNTTFAPQGPPASLMPGDSDASPPAVSAQVVQAAAVVRRFCRLVDEQRYGAAMRLLTAPSVWRLRELRTVRRLRFRSAEAWGAPAGREVTLLVTFTADVTWRSPLTDGLNDVFFTLTRRVTTGEWLIAAVSTSP